MNIELSESDIALISKALESYESQALTDNLMSEVFCAMLGGKEAADDPSFKAAREGRMSKAQEESRVRKSKCLLLRARLAEMSLRPTEWAQLKS